MVFGEVLEWLKRHAWKACIRQKRITGSNPDLSAHLLVIQNLKGACCGIACEVFALWEGVGAGDFCARLSAKIL